ncbi:MAG: hypothetical protein FWG45_03055 [Oscillospiraceae bacterium]|nr:hypothetical protein [Oscillospiraceae bacterium]
MHSDFSVDKASFLVTLCALQENSTQYIRKSAYKIAVNGFSDRSNEENKL